MRVNGKVENYRQIFKSTGLLGSVQALYIGISVIRNKVAALLIGAAGMGLADLYARTLELVGNATNFGLSLSAVKQLSPILCRPDMKDASSQELYAEAEAQVAAVRTWVLLTALLGMAVCAGLSPLLSIFLTDSSRHTMAFAMLAPAVGFSTLTGGEVAVLKAAHRLSSLARATAIGAFLTLAYCTALYSLLGTDGIIPMIILSGGTMFFLNLRESGRVFRYRLSHLDEKMRRTAKPLLRLGTAYILAGLFSSGAEIIVRAAFMHTDGGIVTIGLYAAGLTLTISYSRLIFVAVDADYFPRLTTALADCREMCVTIDRQINTLVVLMAPFLIVYALSLPLVVRLLYTQEFLAIIPMVLAAAPGMYIKAVYTPIAYLPLAKGDSLLFMLMELGYNVVFCLFVIGGWHFAGLVGAGVAISAANLCDYITVTAIYSQRYGYSMSHGTSVRKSLLFLLLLAGVWAAVQSSPLLRLGIGGTAFLLALSVAWPVLKKLRR